MQADAQRNREKKELEDRISVRRSLLEQKVLLLLSCFYQIIKSKVMFLSYHLI